jgi:hypothetical protein
VAPHGRCAHGRSGRGPRLAPPAPSSSRPTAISAAAGTAATTDKEERADSVGGRAPQC